MENGSQTIGGEIIEVKPNTFLGIIGAILGALLGGAIWVAINRLGYIASISGIAIMCLAYKGYVLFSKRENKRAFVISLIISVLMLFLADGFCWGLDIYDGYSMKYEITLWDAMLAVPDFAFDPDLILEFFKEMLIGLVSIGFGCYYCVKQSKAPAPVLLNPNLK